MNNQIVVLGEQLKLDQFIAIARFKAKVVFSEPYCQRITHSRTLVEQWVSEERVMYGVTTGFGALCQQAISAQQSAQLQKNILLSHATSVGTPFSIEECRATMLMVLQNLGQGYSGVRLELLEYYREFLNRGLTPYAPREGSVGYLSPEAHIALVLLGIGQAYYQDKLMPAQQALELAGLQPLTLAAKEGLALISGTTSVTALAALALYDFNQAVKSADIIAAMSVEALQGQMPAFDQRVMSVRPHPTQQQTAGNIRQILANSEIIARAQGRQIQDALSLRCIPQLHGAVKKSFTDALTTIEIEINACCDNPLIWPDEQQPDVISACNPDSSFVGLAMDSACIAATMLAKMSERRNNRLIDGSLSGFPYFLVKNPGLNSGLMIPQYTQAGLLGDMRILCTPSCIDNTPTCANQEDYVASGYNAAKKARQISEKLEYILAIELLSAYVAQGFIPADYKRSPVTDNVYQQIRQHIPISEQDHHLYPYINYLQELIHSGALVALVEQQTGQHL